MQITTTTLIFDNALEAAQFFVGITPEGFIVPGGGSVETVVSQMQGVVANVGQQAGAVAKSDGAATTATKTEKSAAAGTTTTGKSSKKGDSATKETKTANTQTTVTEGAGDASAQKEKTASPKDSESTKTASDDSKTKQVTYLEVRDALRDFCNSLVTVYGDKDGREKFRVMMQDNIGVQKVGALETADFGKLTDVMSAINGDGPYALDPQVYADLAAAQA